IAQRYRRGAVDRRHVTFFVQAEDGIRDRNVTGVQTCALPISWRCPAVPAPRRRRRRRDRAELRRSPRVGLLQRDRLQQRGAAVRSEERRVGKECRERGAAEREKEKGGSVESAWEAARSGHEAQ